MNHLDTASGLLALAARRPSGAALPYLTAAARELDAAARELDAAARAGARGARLADLRCWLLIATVGAGVA